MKCIRINLRKLNHIQHSQLTTKQILLQKILFVTIKKFKHAIPPWKPKPTKTNQTIKLQIMNIQKLTTITKIMPTTN